MKNLAVIALEVMLLLGRTIGLLMRAGKECI
jgi:hypothetical protein